MKAIRSIALLLILFGALLLLGTAGASDAGEIGIAAAIKQSLCGIGLIGAGTAAAYISESSPVWGMKSKRKEQER